jgi:hypothetical protein
MSKEKKKIDASNRTSKKRYLNTSGTIETADVRSSDATYQNVLCTARKINFYWGSSASQDFDTTYRKLEQFQRNNFCEMEYKYPCPGLQLNPEHRNRKEKTGHGNRS